ncbi:hypothetical protein GIB67_032114, partial [Kingdonia uniflora]
YAMNEKVASTASNRIKRDANEGVSEGVNIPTESAEGVNIPQGSEFETESVQAGLGAQPPFPNVCHDFDENIPIFGGYSEGEGATSNDDEKLPIRVHHHQSTWDLRKEPQVVQDFVKLKGLDRIGDISYNYYNFALISAFVERWQPETNTFYFKWGEMTQTLDDVEQLVRLPADGDATVIGGTWGFPTILEVFRNNLLQDLKAFKSLKVGGIGNSLSLKKLKSNYAYKLEKVLSDGTAAAAKKKKGLTSRSVARAYMLWQRSGHGDQQFWPTCITIWVQHLEMMRDNSHAVPRHSSHGYLHISQSLVGFPRRWTPMHTSTVHVGNGPYLLQIDMVVQLCSILGRHWTTTNLWIDKRDSPHPFKEVNFFYGTLASPDVQPYYPNRDVWQFNREQGIPAKRLLTEVSDLWNAKVARKFSPKYEWADCFFSQKWKEFVLKKADRGRKVREGPLVCTEAYLEWFASVSWTTICPITISLAVDDSGIHQRKPASVNEQGDTPVHQSEDITEQYDASILECKKLEEKNTSLEAELRQKSGLEDYSQSLSVELNKKCKEIESLKAVNALLMEQINLQLPPATPLAVLQSHQPVPDTTLIKKYEDLLAAHKDIKKKLIAKEDFIMIWTSKYKKEAARYTDETSHLRHKLVNAEERMKSLEANNSEWACSYGHQHVEYRHMAHLLATYYEKVVVFINYTEAYTFLPLFWARKRNTTSNKERFQNLVKDTIKYWWFGLGADNHFVRLIPRFDAPIPPLSTIFYSHANLEIPLGLQKEQLTRYFDVRARNFKALLREHKCQGYRVNDMVSVGFSTIK